MLEKPKKNYLFISKGFKKISGANVINMKKHAEKPAMSRCYTWTAPVLANGQIYVRNTYGDLVCIDVSQ